MGVNRLLKESKKIKKIYCVDINISFNRNIIWDKLRDIITKTEWEYIK